MKKVNSFTELPEGFEPAYTIDAKSKKFGILLNAVGLVVAVLVMIPFAKPVIEQFSKFEFGLDFWLTYLVFIVGLIAYIVLHELTHGLFYKIFTHHKLTFGLALTCAYCGVPDLYVRRGPALVTTLAPFVVFNIVFGLFAFFSYGTFYFVAAVLMLAIHVSGCVGDLYVTIWSLSHGKGCEMLMNDTGPKQTFYVKKTK